MNDLGMEAFRLIGNNIWKEIAKIKNNNEINYDEITRSIYLNAGRVCFNERNGFQNWIGHTYMGEKFESR